MIWMISMMKIMIMDLPNNQTTERHKADTPTKCTDKTIEMSRTMGRGTIMWTKMESELKKIPAVIQAVSNNPTSEIILITTNHWIQTTLQSKDKPTE